MNHYHYSLKGERYKPKHPINQQHLVPNIIEMHNISVLYEVCMMRLEKVEKEKRNQFIKDNLQFY